METQSPPKPTLHHYHSNVDTSRPFRSVKEAVAIFGKRILVGEIYSSHSPHPETASPRPSPIPSPSGNNNNNKTDNQITSSSPAVVLNALKRLESELEDTKAELKLLKDREQETEVAVASLNAELHKNMSRFAQAEAAAAAKAQVDAATARTTTATSSSGTSSTGQLQSRRKEELIVSRNSTLAQILNLENDAFFATASKTDRNRSMIKKKPIIPLVRDLFFFRNKTI